MAPQVEASPSQGISTTPSAPSRDNRTQELVDAVTDAPSFRIAEGIHKVSTPDAVSVSVQVPIIPWGGTATLTSDLDLVVSPDGGRDYGSFRTGGISGAFTWVTDTNATTTRERRTSFFLDNSASGGGCLTICAGGSMVPGQSGNRFGINLGVSPTPSGSLKFGHGIFVANLLGNAPPSSAPEDREEE